MKRVRILIRTEVKGSDKRTPTEKENKSWAGREKQQKQIIGKRKRPAGADGQKDTFKRNC